MPRSSSRSLDPRPSALLASAGLALFVGCNGSLSFDAGAAGLGNADGGAPTAGGSVPGAGGAAVAASGTGGSAGGPSAAFGTCVTDRDCGLPSLHCNVSSMRCVECLSDGQCPAMRPACMAATGACAACSVTVDCAAGQQCDLQTNKCLTLCVVDADCNDPHSSCNQSGTGQICDDEDDCSMALGGAYCQRSAGACVQCLADSQCGGKTSRCLLPRGLCVDSDDCARTAPFCDPSAHVCSAAVDQ
jgi:hypothetical protein